MCKIYSLQSLLFETTNTKVILFETSSTKVYFIFSSYPWYKLHFHPTLIKLYFGLLYLSLLVILLKPTFSFFNNRHIFSFLFSVVGIIIIIVIHFLIYLLTKLRLHLGYESIVHTPTRLNVKVITILKLYYAYPSSS